MQRRRFLRTAGVGGAAVAASATLAAPAIAQSMPEIKWRLKEEDLADFAAQQRTMLANALACLKPEGRLVYSTCSLEHEENEAIAAPYAPRESLLRQPGRDEGDGFFAAVILPSTEPRL